jgi:hypothetical protein
MRAITDIHWSWIVERGLWSRFWDKRGKFVYKAQEHFDEAEKLFCVFLFHDGDFVSGLVTFLANVINPDFAVGRDIGCWLGTRRIQ